MSGSKFRVKKITDTQEATHRIVETQSQKSTCRSCSPYERSILTLLAYLIVNFVDLDMLRVVSTDYTQERSGRDVRSQVLASPQSWSLNIVSGSLNLRPPSPSPPSTQWGILSPFFLLGLFSSLSPPFDGTRRWVPLQRVRSPI